MTAIATELGKLFVLLEARFNTHMSLTQVLGLHCVTALQPAVVWEYHYPCSVTTPHRFPCLS